MSPVRIRKLPGKSRWRVYDGDHIAARSTTKKNAEKQARLLRAVSPGFVPTGKRNK